MKILIVRVSSLGDVVHNLPVAADIAAHFPDAEIDWVVEDAFAGVVEKNRHISKVIPFNLRRWRKSPFSSQTRKAFSEFKKTLKETAYDWVFDTQGLFKTGVILGLSETAPGGLKVGLANKTEGSGYEPLSRLFHDKSIRIEPHIHVVDRSREVVARALGYTIDTPADFGLTVDEGDFEWLPKVPYAVFFHATSRASKKWPVPNWREIAKLVSDKGLKILLPWGSPSEKQEAEELSAIMPGSTVLPRLSIGDMVTLTGRASFICGVDTGLSHLAAAFNKPTVQIYCNIVRWRTCGNWSDNIISLGGENEVPTVEDVAAAVKTLLEKVSV